MVLVAPSKLRQPEAAVVSRISSWLLLHRLRGSPAILNLPGFNTVQDLTLAEGFPFRLGNEADQIRFIGVRARTGGWTRTLRYAEFSAIRTAEHWSDIQAVGRAKDEILEALVDVRQVQTTGAGNLSNYLTAYKPRRVLVLGDFSEEGRRRLAGIKALMTEFGYSPIFVDEVPDIPHFDLLQKLVAIGSSSRFVVMDDSSRSGHLAEFDEVVHQRWHAIILRLEGSHSSYMTRGVASSLQTMLEYEYDANSLATVLAAAMEEVESRISAREASLRATFPWAPDEE
jgi:hypothetical protein